MGPAKVGLSTAGASPRRLGLTWMPADEPPVRSWLRVILWLFAAQTAANVWYLSERGADGIVVVAVFSVGALVACVPAVPLPWRALFAAFALGVAPLVTLGIPGGLPWLNINMALGVLFVVGFRSLAALVVALAAELAMLGGGLLNGGNGPFGQALVIPEEVDLAGGDALRLVAGIAIVLVMTAIVAALMTSGRRERQDQNARTWQVLHELTSTTTGHSDVPGAAASMLETLCDERWPVGHLWWFEDGAFTNSGLWSSMAKDLPGFVAALEGQGTLAPPASALIARTAAGASVWASWEAGSDGPIAGSATPGRQAAMREAGLSTMLMAPVMAGSKVVALIEMCGYPAYTATPPETLLLQTAAALLSRVAERDQAVRRERARASAANAVLAAVPDAVLVVNGPTRVVIDHNARAVEMIAAADGSGELIGSDVDTILSGAMEHLAGEHDTAVVELAGTHLEIKRTAVDGLPGADHLLFIRDLSSRELAEERLELTTARYRAMTSAAKVGILELDADNVISFANAAGAALFALTDAQIVGAQFVDLVDFGADLLAEADRTGVPAWQTGELTADDGRTFPVMASAVPTLVRGRRAGAIVTIADTSRVAAQTALAQRQEHARELNDTVVQSLAEAQYLLEEHDIEAAGRAITAALASARGTIATLLSGVPLTESILLRTSAATPAKKPPQ